LAAAVVDRREYQGMAFVPPGVAVVGDNVDVEPFFIDENEALLTEYEAFMSAESWVQPRYFSQDDIVPDEAPPVTCVTLYDALAYASWKGKHIPTEAQWVRAISETPEVMQTGAPEWTRTPFSNVDGAVESGGLDFGVLIAIREAGDIDEDGGARMSRRSSLPFEEHDPNLGFRCVRQVPTDRDSVEELLSP
jgi:formylglycine-generating enzyme required for sulfatase activity